MDRQNDTFVCLSKYTCIDLNLEKPFYSFLKLFKTINQTQSD